MASIVTSENWACFKGCDDEFEGIQALSDVDCDFLMALMDESHDDRMEESDEERLNIVIQSLEAEINSNANDEQSISDGEDSQGSSLGQMDGHDFSVSFDDLDVNGWIDMEAMPNCSTGQEFNWHMYNSSHTSCYGLALDQDQYGYSSLWQETTYNSMMY